MKKHLNFLLLFLLPFVIASCEKDENKTDSSSVAQSIVGKWKHVYSYDSYAIYTFEKTGEFTLTETGEWFSTGIWSVKDNVLTLEYKEEEAGLKHIYTIQSITEEKMVLRFDEWWEYEDHGFDGGIEEWTRVD